MYYIATFYSHFGAMHFKKEAGVSSARLMPVPRNLSSSCGTCVRFESDVPYIFNDAFDDEIEQIALEKDHEYEIIYKSANS